LLIIISDRWATITRPHHVRQRGWPVARLQGCATQTCMGLAIMILGLAVFIGSHVLVTLRGQRAALIARLGEGAYRGLFAVVSLIGIILIGYGFAYYRTSGWVDIWMPPRWTRHVTDALVWPAIICILAAYIPGEIKRVLKHPMLVGVKLWAVAHLISNGDLG